jgi:hypothetical protein
MLIRQDIAAMRDFAPDYDRSGSTVRISPGERGAPYRRIDRKPDLNSTHWSISANGHRSHGIGAGRAAFSGLPSVLQSSRSRLAASAAA